MDMTFFSTLNGLSKTIDWMKLKREYLTIRQDHGKFLNLGREKRDKRFDCL